MLPVQSSGVSPLFAKTDEGDPTLIAQRGSHGGKSSRPTIASIVRQFQVNSDGPLVKWQPKALGVIPLGDGPVWVTRTEARMLDNLQSMRGINGLCLVHDIKKNAESTAASLFGGEQDGYQDAVRHALAGALLTQALGPRWTRDFTTAHEALPGNTQGKEAMDLYNNSVGIRIASQHPHASEATLKRLVVDALAKGQLLVIGTKGHLCWSDQVSDDNTGLDPSDPAKGVLPVPDGKVQPGS
jgi:hypothetical protein